MTRPALLTFALALIAPILLGGAAARADVAPDLTYHCGTPELGRQNIFSPLSAGGQDLAPAVPIDGKPWFFARCERPEDPLACALHSGEEEVAVSIAGLDRACEDDKEHLLRLVPEGPLNPGRAYVLRCASTPLTAIQLPTSGPSVDDVAFSTRDDQVTALAPVELSRASARIRRQDDTCCGSDPRWLAVTLSDEDQAAIAPVIAEGGILEVLFDDGDTWIRAPTTADAKLPVTDGSLILTVVAADGTRGPSLTIPSDHIGEDLVYIPCAVGSRVSPTALWLLLPLLWLGVGRRRRRPGRRA